MPKQESTQITNQEIAQMIAGLRDAQSTMLSELLDTMKGSFGTQVKGQYMREDVNAGEAIQHASAMIPLNAKFWFDNAALQTSIANAELIKSLAGWNEIVQGRARNSNSTDNKDNVSVRASLQG